MDSSGNLGGLLYAFGIPRVVILPLTLPLHVSSWKDESMVLMNDSSFLTAMVPIEIRTFYGFRLRRVDCFRRGISSLEGI